ncbi:hypothetical protein MKL26_02615 [Streptococcus suis]|nr:hypothetical protein [Streptococcus suis]
MEKIISILKYYYYIVYLGLLLWIVYFPISYYDSRGTSFIIVALVLPFIGLVGFLFSLYYKNLWIGLLCLLLMLALPITWWIGDIFR